MANTEGKHNIDIDNIENSIIRHIKNEKKIYPLHKLIHLCRIVSDEDSFALLQQYTSQYQHPLQHPHQLPLLISDFCIYWSTDVPIKCEYSPYKTLQQQFAFCEVDRILGCPYIYSLIFSKEPGFYDNGIYICDIRFYNSAGATICKITFEASDTWITMLQTSQTIHDFAFAFGFAFGKNTGTSSTTPEAAFTIDMLSDLAKSNMRNLSIDYDIDSYKLIIMWNIWQHLINPTTAYFCNIIDYFAN
uniref:Uncharacterized protein n=1 Tax=viral metagenome TaxID=1070528 RepID=A0A6C0HPB4_9ZZZZ